MKEKETESTFDERIGTGSGLINPNSSDFRILREAIVEHASQKSHEDRILIQIQGIKYRMDSYLLQSSPAEIIRSGAFLKELIEIIGIPHKVFANYIGYKNSNLSAIYSGKRKMNHDLALKLGQIFQMDPSIWLNIQNKADILELHQGNQGKYQQYQLQDLIKKAS